MAQVTGVMTQGRGDGEEWVTAFLISYSLDAFTWKYAADSLGNKRVTDGCIVPLYAYVKVEKLT